MTYEGIITLRPRGSVTPDEVIESLEEVGRVSEETGIERLLVDAGEIDSMPSTIDVFELTSGFPRSLGMAVLVPDRSDLIEKLRFGENVGVNRGVPVRLFDSLREAVEWLLG